ncbi:hypothetical protein [Endozoicomonas sp. ONNA2]|uniref:hypothetical protein n=1 Tax=Endozoicomonas sp. ONNA2 TaxID=2828741 RepID=UPI0021491A1C|nr:hypothetical protein [Endozoicomonas sp. ONNA2]
MDNPQPLSAQAPATYLANPGVSQEKEPAYQSEPAGSNFSVGDAVWVVMRALSTATECLNFVCRKVVVLASVCVGGITGLLQYAHENLGNRRVQTVAQEENNRIGQQPGDQAPGDTAQQTAYRQNPPMEEYVRQGANKWQHFVESGTSPGSEYSWMSLVGTLLSITVSVCVLGVAGTLLLHTPHWLFKAEPYFNLNQPTSLIPPTTTQPSDHQNRQRSAFDPQADSRPRDNPASHCTHRPVEPPPTAVAGEPGQPTGLPSFIARAPGGYMPTSVPVFK